MNRIKNKVVLLLGDNFYPVGVSGAEDPQWKSVFLNNFSPDKHYLPVLGNHDYIQHPKHQLFFRQGGWYMPARYYSVEIEGLLAAVVNIDTVQLCPLTSIGLGVPFFRLGSAVRQLEWIENQFEQFQSQRWRIVVGHYPVFSGSSHGGTGELQEKLLPLLKKHGIQLYISGHEHNFQHIVREGIHFVVCGTGCKQDWFVRSQTPGLKFFSGMGGFLLLQVKAESLEGTFVDEFDRPLYSFHI